jgi:uncharacterized protein (DUF1684 family)
MGCLWDEKHAKWLVSGSSKRASRYDIDPATESDTTMTMTERSDYIAELDLWRQEKEKILTAPDGWLSLVGLHWLNDGLNTVGASDDSDVQLEGTDMPARLGTIELVDSRIVLHVAADAQVTVDGVQTREAVLRPDTSPEGASQVSLGTVTFFVIERSGSYAIRVRDSENPARLSFTGRRWFPVDPNAIANATFHPHEEPRQLEIVTSAGNTQVMTNPGYVQFMLNGETHRLEAFDASGDQIWFVFKDATSGRSTYGAGRFLYAALPADGAIVLDFNRAYHPPCAFTHFAACPLAPKGNTLPVEILAGERL